MNEKKIHRVDGPVIIWTNGFESQEKWYYNGKLHRITGPALISYKNNIVILKYWFFNGRIHRTDGPALLDFYNDGKLEKESWVIDGKPDDNKIKIIKLC